MKTISIKDKIKEYFFLNPTIKLRVRQIERLVNVPLPSAIRYTKELERERILKIYRIAGIITYSADRTSKKFIIEKGQFNIRKLYASKLVDFLVEELSNPPIIVFGSYARAEDIETSDIDIYIETPVKAKIDFKRFEKLLHHNIQAFIYKKINEVENRELANNIINGVILNGFVEVFK